MKEDSYRGQRGARKAEPISEHENLVTPSSLKLKSLSASGNQQAMSNIYHNVQPTSSTAGHMGAASAHDSVVPPSDRDRVTPGSFCWDRLTPALLLCLLLMCLALQSTLIFLKVSGDAAGVPKTCNSSTHDEQASSNKYQEEASKNLTLTRTELEKMQEKSANLSKALKDAEFKFESLKKDEQASSNNYQEASKNLTLTRTELEKMQEKLANLTKALKDAEFKFESSKKALFFFKVTALITGKKIFTSTGNQDRYIGARDICTGAGGQLASPENKEENDAVYAISKKYGARTLLGINDIQTEGTFRLPSNKSITFSNWMTGEPNNDRGNENCVELLDSTGLWNDDNCGDLRLVICEFMTIKD